MRGDDGSYRTMLIVAWTCRYHAHAMASPNTRQQRWRVGGFAAPGPPDGCQIKAQPNKGRFIETLCAMITAIPIPGPGILAEIDYTMR